jgi:Spy/CpxP family protein refolding chaperone
MVMTKLRLLVLSVGLLAIGTSGLTGQDAKKESKDEPKTKAKGTLPANWRLLGLTDDQKQKVYAIDAKYDEEIDKLTAKIAELKEKRKKEQLAVLTTDQKKRLEDELKKKAGTDK